MKMSIFNGKAIFSRRYGYEFVDKKTRSAFKTLGRRFFRRVVNKNYIREALVTY